MIVNDAWCPLCATDIDSGFSQCFEEAQIIAFVAHLNVSGATLNCFLYLPVELLRMSYRRIGDDIQTLHQNGLTITKIEIATRPITGTSLNQRYHV
jgi:hypothetical protein